MRPPLFVYYSKLMRKVVLALLMLFGVVGANAQDVNISVYDTDKTAADEERVEYKMTTDTMRTVVAPLISDAQISEQNVMEVQSSEPMVKVELRKESTKELLQTITLNEVFATKVDLNAYQTENILIVFYGKNGNSSEFTWGH